MNKYLTALDPSLCCGCGACVAACPKGCLEMQPSEEGFEYPVLINDNCISCGICTKKCPIENPPQKNEIKNCYAAKNNNTAIRNNSSSGGIFASLAEYVISQGGSVFGAELDIEKRSLSHVEISKSEDLPRIMGSKYIQSKTDSVYPGIKKLLEEGKPVLFAGTSCQAAGLRLYLGREYDNLYIVDLLCHGVPSPKIFRAYVKHLEKKHGGYLCDICFRDKEKNGWSITLRYDIQQNGKTKRHYVAAGLSPYFFAFLRGRVLRESCYKCPYASLERAGDITLADFWGIEKAGVTMDTAGGVSCVLVTSEKGERLFDAINEKTERLPVTQEQATMGNINFYKPTERPAQRNTVYSDLDIHGFDYVAKTYCKNPRKLRIIIKNILGLGKKK